MNHNNQHQAETPAPPNYAILANTEIARLISIIGIDRYLSARRQFITDEQMMTASWETIYAWATNALAGITTKES